MKVLNNLKVIELATVLAGPAVGQFFAELGARVIKVENPATHGDVTRSWKLAGETGNVSAYFSCVNWGKTSIALDITNQAHLLRLYEMVKEADIVIANYKPGDAEKLHVDYQTLKSINPGLIYGHITGYGTQSQKVGYDAVIQAEAGFIYMNGEADGNPVKMPVALIDLLAAHQLKEGLLVALLNRATTGEGMYVSVSLYDAAVASLANQATNWLVAGHIPQRMGSEHPNIVPYGNILPTSDDSAILVAVGSDKQFASLCQILDLPELPADPRFINNQQRVKNRTMLNAMLAEAVQKREKTKLLRLLDEEKVPTGGVNNMAEVFSNPLAASLLLSAEDGKLKGVRTFVARFNDQQEFAPVSAPPEFKFS